MRPHYDLKNGRKNPYAERFPQDAHAVVIDPDVWTHFGSAEAINDGLRLLVQFAGVMRRTSTRGQKTRRVA